MSVDIRCVHCDDWHQAPLRAVEFNREYHEYEPRPEDWPALRCPECGIVDVAAVEWPPRCPKRRGAMRAGAFLCID